MSAAPQPVRTAPSATAEALAALAFSLRLGDVPAEVVAHAKLIVREIGRIEELARVADLASAIQAAA